MQQRDYISCAMEQADLIIAVGYDLVEYSPKRWNPDGKLPILHINMTHAEIDSSYIPKVEVIGDISDSLEEILKRVKRQGRPEPANVKLREEIRADYNQYADDYGFPIKPQKLIYDLRQVLAPEDILISDVGAHKNVDRPQLPLPASQHLPDFQRIRRHGNCDSRGDGG